MFTGKTVFAQLMSLIPRRDFNTCVARYKGDYRSRNLSCYDQFLVMCLAQYASKNSLRDIEASLIAVYSFLILALAKKKFGLEQSLYTISQTLGFVLFEKVPINQLFNKNQNFISSDEYPNLFSMS